MDISSDSNSARRTGASAQSIEQAVDRIALVGHLCAVVVIVGVALEYKTSFIDLWHNFSFATFRQFVGKTLGGILVAIGVAGELFFGFLADRKDNQLRSINAERIAELNLLAEQERHARIKLEARLAPRTLSAEARQILKDRLSKFRTQPFRVEVDLANVEGIDFAQDIHKCLTEDCGWVGEVHCLPSFNTLAPGVTVTFGKEDAEAIRKNLPSTYEIFIALDDAIKSTDIAVAEGGLRDLNYFPIPRGVVAIDIGPKP